MTTNLAPPAPGAVSPSTLELRAQLLTSSNALRAYCSHSTNLPSSTANPEHQDQFLRLCNTLIASLDLLDSSGNLRG